MKAENIVIALFLLIILSVPVLAGYGFYRLINEPLPQWHTTSTISVNIPPPSDNISQIPAQVPGRVWHIIRTPQTFGMAPGQSGVTEEHPYDTTLPNKLSYIPNIVGIMYGDNVTYSLYDIIGANKGKDIVVSFGDTTCGACLGVIRTFGEFKATYGDVVTMVAVMENDPGRLEGLIKKYALDSGVIFVSNISNLGDYGSVAYQNYHLKPITLHVNPDGEVDRILIGSMGSVVNLKKFIGIDLQEVF